MSSASAPPLPSNQGLQTFEVASQQFALYYTKLRSNALFVFSIFNFMFWTSSTALQTFAIAMAFGFERYRQFDYESHATVSSLTNSYDANGHGIWCALFYMMTALLGYSASYKPTKKLLVATLVFSSLSVIGASITTFVAGITNAANCITILNMPASYYTSIRLCYDWRSIEIALMVVSFLAGITNIVVLVLVAIALRAGPRRMSTDWHPDLINPPAPTRRHRHHFVQHEPHVLMIANPVQFVQHPFQVVYQPVQPRTEPPHQMVQPVSPPKQL